MNEKKKKNVVVVAGNTCVRRKFNDLRPSFITHHLSMSPHGGFVVAVAPRWLLSHHGGYCHKFRHSRFAILTVKHGGRTRIRASESQPTSGPKETLEWWFCSSLITHHLSCLEIPNNAF